MRSKLESFAFVALILGFVVVTISLFLPHTSLIPIYSLYLFLCLSVQWLGKDPVAFMMVGFTTLFGIFCMTKLPETQMLAIPLLILVLWGCSFVVHLHQERYRMKHQKGLADHEEKRRNSRLLKQEIKYYEVRKQKLQENATSRRQLAKAAQEMGSLLDPSAIQSKLVETAQSLFQNIPVALSYGQNPDAIDKYIIQKRQPVLVPSTLFKGNPFMAVPITAQQSVAGILRVGGLPGPEFSRDDLRMLDILASLASLSLDNSLLFSQVQETALRDGLTGLLTHKAFQDNLESAILEASRYNKPLSLILTDVDHFKSINDTYGHQAGDQVLQGFAHVLVRNVRGIDIVARYGGEEFIVLLLETSHKVALEIAENIRVDLESQRFDAGKVVIEMTGSFGVATFPDDAASPQQLLRQADQRMYAAKRAGRNRVYGKAA